MLRENTVFAQKIMDFYADKGVECSVVDEHLSLLVTLSSEGRTHEFRYGNRAFGGRRHTKKFYQVLEREWSKLMEAAPGSGPAPKNRPKSCRRQEDAGEEACVSI